MKNREFFDLAADLEANCGDWENSKGLSQEAIDRVLAQAEILERQDGNYRQEKVPRVRIKKRYLAVLAAALVLLMGMGAVGDRAWIADSSDLERRTEVTTKINTEERDSQLREEEAIYQEIGEKLGIAPLWFGYMPEGMVLDSYTVMEGTGWAYVNYIYNANLVSVQMMKRAEDSSNNVQWDGNAEELEFVSDWYEVKAYRLKEDPVKYAANITYGNGYYNVWGAFSDQEEFFAVLEKIYFKTL